MKKKFVVVLGYGCDLTDDLKKYLQEVAKYISMTPITGYVITSGGFTQHETAPGISEARMMRDYLIELGVFPGMIVKEAKSQTTIDNLFYTNRKINRLAMGDEWEAVIFCDSIRKLKVSIEAKHFYSHSFTVRGVNFNRSLSEKLFQWFFATPLEILLFRVSSLQRKFSSLRFERSKGR